MTLDVDIEPVVRQGAPALKVLILEAKVTNHPTPDALWSEIDAEALRLKSTLQISDINKLPAIAATRAAYKALGKDPNRYRPSAESLTRRCVKGLGLYRTSAIVDLINLLSLKTGVSIGGFDRDKIIGPSLRLGVGAEGEPYEAIGRGSLNIAGLPVFRDAAGGIGTPTSDNERTKLSEDTLHLLMTINLYHGLGSDMILHETIRLLQSYADASEITYQIIS